MLEGRVDARERGGHDALEFDLACTRRLLGENVRSQGEVRGRGGRITSALFCLAFQSFYRMALVVSLLLMQHATKEEEDKAIVIVTLPGGSPPWPLLTATRTTMMLATAKIDFAAGGWWGRSWLWFLKR